MAPYADFTYFGLLLIYILLPAVALGMLGWANARWGYVAIVAVCIVQFSNDLPIRADFHVREIWVVLGYAVWQSVIAQAFLRWRSRPAFYAAFSFALLPLLLAKYLPLVAPGTELGFAGISYVSFRALDVIFSVQDGVVKKLPPAQYAAFLFFFPTISSGPIDRFRRFSQDWQRRRSRVEFLDDLDTAVERVVRGFLYKFIIAALIRTYWMDRIGRDGLLNQVNYMYAYSLYLFFDFAGYSAFAIGFSHLLGVRSPENFHLPFLARNIRDFWNRWHISLSFWFRDHVYMRFLLTAAKKKWFKGRHTANYLGLFLTFGLMGVWHGIEPHYLIYGFYHAALLSGYDWFARWNKQAKFWGDGKWWAWADTFLTIHAVCFGLLIFSGRLTPSHKSSLPAATPSPATGVAAPPSLVPSAVNPTRAPAAAPNPFSAPAPAATPVAPRIPAADPAGAAPSPPAPAIAPTGAPAPVPSAAASPRAEADAGAPASSAGQQPPSPGSSPSPSLPPPARPQ